jgi:hypothetical protein
MTPDARARRQLREGCATNLGCVALPVGSLVLVLLFGLVNRFVSHRILDPSSVDAAFTELSSVAGHVLLLSGFTLLLTLLFIGAAFEKSKVLGAILAVPLLALGVWSAYTYLYDDFIALAARDGTVRLIYRVPRPSRVIRASDVKLVDQEKVTGGNEMSSWHYRLLIETTSGESYQSEKVPNQAAVELGGHLVMREKYRDAAAKAREAGDDAGAVAATSALGLMELRLDHRDAARRLCSDALTTAEQSADPLGIASAEYCLASVDHLDGHLPDAERRFRRSFELRSARLDDEHPDRYDVVGAYASVLEALGRAEEARQVRGSMPPRTPFTELRRTMSKEEVDARIKELLEKRRTTR